MKVVYEGEVYRRKEDKKYLATLSYFDPSLEKYVELDINIPLPVQDGDTVRITFERVKRK